MEREDNLSSNIHRKSKVACGQMFIPAEISLLTASAKTASNSSLGIPGEARTADEMIEASK